MSDLSDLLLGKNSTAKTKPTYADYATWVEDASADNEITKDEWKQGASLFGFNAKKARKAFKNGNFDSYMNPYRNKLERNYYAWRDPNTGKVSLIAQGDDNWDEEAFQNAKFKGTDRNKVATAYNDAVTDARKKAQVTYGNDGRYHITYKVGDWDVNDVDVTDADWFKDDKTRQKNAQLYSYGKAVDSYYAKPVNQKYLGDDGLNLLKSIGYDVKNIEGFDSKEDSDKQTIRDNIGYKLRSWYADQAGTSWDSSAKADALWKHLMEYYNGKGIAWLPTLDWQAKSRYKDYTQLGTTGNSSAHGSLIGFSKKGGFLRARTLAKGGMIPKAGWGVKVAEKIGGPAWLGQGLDLATDFVPLAGTVNRIYDKTLTSPGEIALSLGLDLLGPAAKGLKVAYKGYKIAKGAGKAANAVTKATKAVTKAKGQFEKITKSRLFKKEYEAYSKAAKKALEVPNDPKATRAFYEAENALRNKMYKVPEAKKYVSALDTARETLTKAQIEARDALKVSTRDGISLAWRDSRYPILSSIFGPSKKTAALLGLTRMVARNSVAAQNDTKRSRATVTQNPEQNTESADSSTSSTGNSSQNGSETAYAVDPNTGARVPVTADSEYINSQITTI